MAANQSVPTSVLDSMYFDAFYALDCSYMLRQIYVADLKSHQVDPSSLPLHLGEGKHFRKLGKPRGTSKDVEDFLTLSYKGAYALFLGTSIMLDKSSARSEKNYLVEVKTELLSILTSLYWQLVADGFPVPKTNEAADKAKLQKKLENLIKLFLKEKRVRALIPPFIGEETLLLKWGLNFDYIVCLTEFMSKVKGASARRSTI